MDLVVPDAEVTPVTNDFPSIHSKVYKTQNGTSYLRVPGVVLVSKPQVNLSEVKGFVDGFDAELEFDDYLRDSELPPATQLLKFAGQACYASFSPKRTKNDAASKYFRNIKEQKHGSVLAHASYSFLIYGVSRSLTHELVRHGIGTGTSQLSQRYVSGKVLRFVERPEYINDLDLHYAFERRIDRAAAEYEQIAERLYEKQAAGDTSLSGERKTDLRKRVQQTARSVLPNETETFLVFTGNMRAWRHMLEMRASEHAETEIRELFMRIFYCLRAAEPILFDDYSVKTLKDGSQAVHTEYQKV